MKWLRIGVSLMVLAWAGVANARVFGMGFIHGSGGAELADPSWASDYWGNGAAVNAALGCGGMPSVVTHVDGTKGLNGAAFTTYDCGCDSGYYFGCLGSYGTWNDPNNHAAGCTWHSISREDPLNFATIKQKGVVDQLYDFITSSGVTDLTLVTHSMGGNVARWFMSKTDFYDACRTNPTYGALGMAKCTEMRNRQLRVISTISTVLAMHAPFLGSQAADKAESLNGSWWGGWLLELIHPYTTSTRDCTTAKMANYNQYQLYGTAGRPWPSATAYGEPLRIARWIGLLSPLTAGQILEDAQHAEDWQLSGLVGSGLVVFPNGYSDGLVSWPSMAGMAQVSGDLWYFQGQHDAVAQYRGVSGYVGNNHFHEPKAIGPRFWTPTAWDPSCPAVQGCLQPAAYYDAPRPVCPDPICKSNPMRGYPLGTDEEFAIAGYVQARAAAACGPAIVNQQVPLNRCWPQLAVCGYWGDGTPVYCDPPRVAACTPAYETYAPLAGQQTCNYAC